MAISSLNSHTQPRNTSFSLYLYIIVLTLLLQKPLTQHIWTKPFTILSRCRHKIPHLKNLCLTRPTFLDTTPDFLNRHFVSLQTPSKGPFHLKCTTGRSPVIDVGTVEKIKTEDIQVFPSIMSIERDIEFANGKTSRFQAILFATGYKSNARKWLKDYGALFNDDGMPGKKALDHWKGENGLYCIGFARTGLFGISNDAQNIAKDISLILSQQKNS